MAATFRGTSVVEANSGTVAWPSGTAAGDAAVILIFGNGTLALTATGFSPDVTNAQVNTAGSLYSTYSKGPLSAGDISSPPTWAGTTFGGIQIYTVQGASGVAFKTNTANVNGATNTLTGFTKASDSSLIGTLVVDRATSPVTIGSPAGFTGHTQGDTTFFSLRAADIASGSYTNNATVQWTGLDIASSSGAVLYEFTAGGGSTPISALAASAAAASLTRQDQRSSLASSAAVASLTRAITTARSALTSSAAVASLARQTGKALAASSAAAASFAAMRVTLVAAQAASASVASLTRAAAHLVSALASSAAVASLSRQATRQALAASAAAASLFRQATRSALATSPAVASESGIKARLQEALASSASVASLLRSAGKLALASNLSIASDVRQTTRQALAASPSVASLIRQGAKSLAASSVATASLSAVKVMSQVALASSAAVASLSRGAGKVLRASSSSVASIRRAIARVLSAASRAMASLSTINPPSGSQISIVGISDHGVDSVASSDTALAGTIVGDIPVL